MANIAEHLNAEGGTSAGMDVIGEEEQSADDSETPAMASPIGPAPANNVAPTFSSRIPVPEPVMYGREVHSDGPQNPPRPISLDVSALSPMALLRPSFLVAVNNERVRLQRVREDLGESVGRTRHCLTEQRERLNVLQRKVVEKSRSHDRAADQFRRAREYLKATKLDDGASTTKEPPSVKKPPNRMCEHLVASRLDNVAVSYSQLQFWELKMQRQKDVVARTSEELTAAEQSLQEKLEVLDTALGKLHSVANLLGGL